MAINLSFIGGAGWQFFDNNGSILSGGKLYTYAAGTTTLLATYTSRTGLTANTNPIILDSAGRTPEQVWSTEGLLYKYVVKTAVDVQLRSWDNIGGSTAASDLAAPSGASLVGYMPAGVGAVATTVQSKLRETASFDDVGIYSDVIDQTAMLNQAMADYSHLVINGNIAITPPMSIPSNTTIEFRHGAKIIALATGSHIIGNEDSAENITLINPEVDGANIRGLNGFGFGTALALPTGKNVRLINPIARNCLRNPVTGGGRAFTVQGNASSASFINAKVFDCTTAVDVNGGAAIGAVQAMMMDVLYAEGCQEAVSIYSDGTNTNATVPPTVATNLTACIGTVIARNCGRTTDTTLYSGSGVASDQDGGVIVARRGRNVAINNLIVNNDLTYTIGALFRGTGNNIKVNNFEMHGLVQAVCIIGSAENLLPLTPANDANYGICITGRHHSTANNIVDVRIATGTNYITGCEFDIATSAFVAANSILKTLSSFRSDSKIRVLDAVNQRCISGTLLDVFTYANTLALATKHLTLCSSAQHWSANTFEANATFNKDIVTGSASRIDYSTAGVSAGALEGYVQIKVGGVTKKLAYYAV